MMVVLRKIAEQFLSCQFFPQTPLSLNRQLTQNADIKLECLADIFPKMNKVKLSFQGKQLTVFVTNDKTHAFKQLMY